MTGTRCCACRTQALTASGYDGPPVWLHCDLHPANVLVNDGQVSGVIDFGDITLCDPANDLSVAWMLLPPRLPCSLLVALPGGRGADGRADDALRMRARGWALNLAIVFLAHSEDNPVLLEVGRRTLSTVLEDQRGPAGSGAGRPASGAEAAPPRMPGIPQALRRAAAQARTARSPRRPGRRRGHTSAV